MFWPAVRVVQGRAQCERAQPHLMIPLQSHSGKVRNSELLVTRGFFQLKPGPTLAGGASTTLSV